MSHIFLGLARTIYVRCIYGSFGKGITKHTVIYSAYTRSGLPYILSSPSWSPFRCSKLRDFCTALQGRGVINCVSHVFISIVVTIPIFNLFYLFKTRALSQQPVSPGIYFILFHLFKTAWLLHLHSELLANSLCHIFSYPSWSPFHF